MARTFWPGGRQGGLGKHRPQLGQLQKPLVAVVLPHAAGADAAEGQVVLAHVHGAFVDAHAAGHGAGDNRVLDPPVSGKKIQRQGPGPVIDVV